MPIEGARDAMCVPALCLSSVALVSDDLARTVSHFENVLGLNIIARSADEVDFASLSGADAVRLSAGSAAGCTGLSLQIAPKQDTADVCRKLKSFGIDSRVFADPYPGVASAISFVDPNGFAVELLTDRHLSAPGDVRGVSPLRLGHIAFTVADPLATSQFYHDVLGFRVSDWVGDSFVFMRCGHEHHTVNFLKSPSAQATGKARVHHVAFEMRDAAALTSACDLLARGGFSLIWGPVRHGPGHNIAIYYKSPGGPVIELYAEMDVITREELGYFDPRPWHLDRPQRPKVWNTTAPRDIWGPPPSEVFVALAR